MPRGYPICSIREATRLTDENWKKVLKAMTKPVTILEICEETGLERHTVEAIRRKVLYALLADQKNTELKGKTWIYCYGIKRSEKGPKKENMPENSLNTGYYAVFLEDKDGKCAGTTALSTEIEIETERMPFQPPQHSLRINRRIHSWIQEHCQEWEGGREKESDLPREWLLFLGHFRGISSKYLDAFVAWFCYLHNSKVIGKKKSGMVNDMWRMIRSQSRSVSNRRREYREDKEDCTNENN